MKNGSNTDLLWLRVVLLLPIETAALNGTVFARIHPKLAVYSHIAQLGTPAAPAPGLAEIVGETRQTYQGPLAIGEDLMTFDIGANGIAIYRAAR